MVLVFEELHYSIRDLTCQLVYKNFLERRRKMFDEGHKIRVSLAEIRKTQVWLIQELAQHGIITDKAELSGVLSGTRHGPKPDLIISTSKKIITESRE